MCIHLFYEKGYYIKIRVNESIFIMFDYLVFEADMVENRNDKREQVESVIRKKLSPAWQKHLQDLNSNGGICAGDDSAPVKLRGGSEMWCVPV